MGEHTPTPQWSLHRQRDECMGGDYYRYSIWLGERIVLMADIALNPLNSEKTIGDLIEAANATARLTRENEAMRKALKAVIGLQPYINNPSAWDHFDDEMSERLGTIVDGALASLKEPTDAQA